MFDLICISSSIVWLLVYVLIGWTVSRDERDKRRRLFYAFCWLFLPWLFALSNKYKKYIESRKPRVTKLDETDNVSRSYVV